MPLSTIFANKVGRYRFAMACKKASTTTSTRTGRYGFMNRSNLIIFLYFHSNYRYIGICQGINPRSTYSCLLRRRAMEREGCWGHPRPRQGSFAPCTPSFMSMRGFFQVPVLALLWPLVSPVLPLY